MSNSLFLKALLLMHCILYKHPHLLIIMFVTKCPRSSTIIYVRIIVTNPKLYQLQSSSLTHTFIYDSNYDSPTVIYMTKILIRLPKILSMTIILSQPQSYLRQILTHPQSYIYIYDNHSHSPTAISMTISSFGCPQSYL